MGSSGFLGRGSKARESHHCHHVGIPNLGWKELLWCRLLFHCSFTISSGSGSGFLFLFRFFLYSFCFSSSSFSSIILWSKSYSTWYRKMLTIKCRQIISIFTFFSSSLALFFANRSFTLRSPLNLIIKSSTLLLFYFIFHSPDLMYFFQLSCSFPNYVDVSSHWYGP